MNTLTLLFLVILGAGLLLQLWLYRRHDGHVQAHREQVPDAFADQVSGEEHRKAADYIQSLSVGFL